MTLMMMNPMITSRFMVFDTVSDLFDFLSSGVSSLCDFDGPRSQTLRRVPTNSVRDWWIGLSSASELSGRYFEPFMHTFPQVHVSAEFA